MLTCACAWKESTCNLQRLPPAPFVPTVHQAWFINILPLLTSYLVLAHGCLTTFTAYSIDLISQEAGNCIYFIVIPFSRSLGSFIVWHPSLFLPHDSGILPVPGQVFSVYWLLGCPHYLTLTPSSSRRDTGLCIIDCHTLSRRHSTLLPLAYQGSSSLDWNDPCGSVPTYLLPFFNKMNPI